MDADAEEEDEDALEPMSSTRAHGASGVAVEDGFSVSFVVTGVALNGFARYAGTALGGPLTPPLPPSLAGLCVLLLLLLLLLLLFLLFLSYLSYLFGEEGSGTEVPV